MVWRSASSPRTTSSLGASATMTTWVRGGAVRSQTIQKPLDAVEPIGDHDDDRRVVGGRFVEARRDRPTAAVADPPILDHIGWGGWQELEPRPAVDHPPASGLDLGAESIGLRPVARLTRRRSSLGERADLVGRLVPRRLGHARRLAGTGRAHRPSAVRPDAGRPDRADSGPIGLRPRVPISWRKRT